MKIAAKITRMSSPGLPLGLASMRPTAFAPANMRALRYIAGLIEIADEIVRKHTSPLAPSRGEPWYVRSTMNRLSNGLKHPEVAKRLRAMGITKVRRSRDVFWFTVQGCPYSIRVVTRPAHTPPPPAEGEQVQEALDLGIEEFGKDTHPYLMMDRDRHGVVSVTAALVTNPQHEWVHQGATIVDEVVIYSSAMGVIQPEAAPPVPAEDEAAFRAQMTLTVEETDLAEDQSAERYDKNEQKGADDEQAGGEHSSSS